MLGVRELTNATPFIHSLIGKPVSHVWRGYGSALFLEFGELTPRKRLSGAEGIPDGELTLMIEWSWRIENPRSILGGSWSSERRWSGMFKRLVGNNVTGVEFFGTLPEIAVSLSSGLRVVSFMTAEGQPSWTLFARNPNLGTLCVSRGRLCVKALQS